MTAEKTDWNFFDLRRGIEILQKEIKACRGTAFDPKPFYHTIKFIEYNMKEMDITPEDNGDY